MSISCLLAFLAACDNDPNPIPEEDPNPCRSISLTMTPGADTSGMPDTSASLAYSTPFDARGTDTWQQYQGGLLSSDWIYISDLGMPFSARTAAIPMSVLS